MTGGVPLRLAAWTRRLVGEPLLGAAARRFDARQTPVDEPSSIFVLRNNDLGDVLVVTPLFDALRRRFPAARIVAGVGQWSVEVLKGNPHLSAVMVVNAPWFNKVVQKRGLRAELAYVFASETVEQLRQQQFDVGVDVLGSVAGGALLLRAGIPRRLGVHGYAGGHSSCHSCVKFDEHEHVGRSALRFAELLGLSSSELPENRPQLFLDADERAAGQRRWSTPPGARRRIVIGHGAGEPNKGWPIGHFRDVVMRLSADEAIEMVVVGGPQDRTSGDFIAAAGSHVTNLAGQCSLRETFGLVAASDAVVTNSSMLLHAAAAFNVPTAVVLGPAYTSARQHHEQWGYPGACRSLGPEPGTPGTLATPGDAVECVRSFLR